MKKSAIDEPCVDVKCGWIERERVEHALADAHPFCESPLHGDEIIPAAWIVLFTAPRRRDYIAGKCFLCIRHLAMDFGYSHPAKGSLFLDPPGQPDIVPSAGCGSRADEDDGYGGIHLLP